jgi:hypothetical protein
MDVYTMSLTSTGFDLTFTQEIDVTTAGNPENYHFRHYYYEYHQKYGSDQFDVQSVPVTNITVAPDRKKVSLTLGNLKPGYIYELKLGAIQSATGIPLANKLICYTIKQLKN